jgi:hypothetical protein
MDIGVQLVTERPFELAFAIGACACILSMG